MTRGTPRRIASPVRPAGPARRAAAAAAVAALLLPCGAASADTTISDDRLETALESELTLARGVSHEKISIESAAGVVTLAGSVDNALARERAERIATSLRGVRSVVNRIQVEAVERSDEAVRDDVVRQIAADPATESFEVDVHVDGAKVVLEGEVQSWAERELAGRVARSVRGVRSVENRIEVAWEDRRPDGEIRAEVEQRLFWDPRVDAALLEVAVEKARVDLDGTVGSAFERSLARDLAWVVGVEAVDTEDLRVEWWARDRLERKERTARVSDEEIREAVKRALFYDPRVRAFEPTVRVRDGVVTLEGSVSNLKARRAAASDARNTVGVRSVRNELGVEPEADRAPSEIAEDVRRALRLDPYVSHFDIDVEARKGGELVLRGEVDAAFERAQAGDLAARTRGVEEVDNDIRVREDGQDVGSLTLYDWDPVLSDLDYDVQSVERRPDDEIEQSIRSQLWWSPFVDSDEVFVEVQDGKARLTGAVDSWQAREAATENALEGGSLEVVNDLDVALSSWSRSRPVREEP